MSAQPTGGAAWAVAAVIVMSGCGGSSPSPDRPSSDPPSTIPGATTVYGTERLAWLQPGHVSGMQFRAYVDNTPVELNAAACNGTIPDSECSSPLPSMTDGVHSIALAAVSSGLEGERSPSITVQKLSTRSVVSVASFPDARVSAGGLRFDAVVTISGVSFTIDVVARGLKGPTQLAATPDGRLLIADADARVHLIRPGEPESREVALDARMLLQPSSAGGLGLAVHPDFAQNRFVYVSFLAQDGPERTLLRIVRLREVGRHARRAAGVVRGAARGSSSGSACRRRVVRRPAKAPVWHSAQTGSLYTLLPAGVEFDNEPAASRPSASLLRITDEGRVPEAEPLSGVTAHPLGFAWHPSTAALWLILPGVNGEAVVRSGADAPVSGIDVAGGSVIRLTDGGGSSSGALVIQDSGATELARAFPQGIDHESIGALRLTVPIIAERFLDGVSDRIIDVVPAGGGTLYLATSNAGGQEGAPGNSGDVVVRLRPQPR